MSVTGWGSGFSSQEGLLWSVTLQGGRELGSLWLACSQGAATRECKGQSLPHQKLPPRQDCEKLCLPLPFLEATRPGELLWVAAWTNRLQEAQTKRCKLREGRKLRSRMWELEFAGVEAEVVSTSQSRMEPSMARSRGASLEGALGLFLPQRIFPEHSL